MPDCLPEFDRGAEQLQPAAGPLLTALTATLTALTALTVGPGWPTSSQGQSRVKDQGTRFLRWRLLNKRHY
eukprot:9470461-Pyramimonas_sp.AAC.1